MRRHGRPTGQRSRRRAPTVVAHPSPGRLLIFDATDEKGTPVGDLPHHGQGSFGPDLEFTADSYAQTMRNRL